jgi:hypothetical protein
LYGSLFHANLGQAGPLRLGILHAKHGCNRLLLLEIKQETGNRKQETGTETGTGTGTGNRLQGQAG